MPRNSASPTRRPARRPRVAVDDAAVPAAGAGDSASTARDEASATTVAAPGPLSWRRLSMWLTLGLALALLLAGVGGVGFDLALRAALRAPTAVDEASAVCDDLRSQRYDALAAEMDPTPDGANAGPFDRTAFVAALRDLDQREGTVRACSLRLLGNGADGASVLFSMTVRRTRVADPLGSMVVVRRETRGGWAISRASTFYDAYYDAPE